MSRIGKLPVEIPAGVEVKVENNVVTAKGPKGCESVEIRHEIEVKVEGNQIILTRKTMTENHAHYTVFQELWFKTL